MKEQLHRLADGLAGKNLQRFLLRPLQGRKSWRRWLLGVAVLWLSLYLGWPMNRDERTLGRTHSLRITDRNGNLLRDVPGSDFSRSQPVSLRELPPEFIAATLAAEDKHFYTHFGIDILATLRAVWQNLSAMRVVSGASTITQQTARLMLGEGRGVWAKIHASLYALRLEVHLSKDEILTEYVNRAPYGNQNTGIAAAAMCYFSKPPSQLTLAEAALLAGLPQSPTGYDPLRHPALAHKRKEEVLRRMRTNEVITEPALTDALHQTIDAAAAKQKFLAPHFVDYVLSELQRRPRVENLPPESQRFLSSVSSPAEISTSLDQPLQQRCEQAVEQNLHRLRQQHVTNASVVVMDNRTGEILAMVGSADYFNAETDGAVNGALAARQAGSSVKPFTYAIALERGYTPATILADLPLNAQLSTARPDTVSTADTEENPATAMTFIPRNYDRKHHGPVRLRQSLACSYNVPAVKVLEHIGVASLLERLRGGLRLTTLPEDAAHYGLGLTLGNAEVKLIEMVRAYGVFARHGRFLETSFFKVQPEPPQPFHPATAREAARVFTPQVSYLILDILSDNAARSAAFGDNSVLRFPFAAACKTGTTKDFRDNWAFCVLENFTVGVWVGNFDGTPMQNLSGVSGAGPILRDAVIALSERFARDVSFQKANFDMPAGIRIVNVCPVFGERYGSGCAASVEEKFISGTEPKAVCQIHRTLPLDARNLLLASDTTPERFKIFRAFECFPPEYRRWAVQQHKPLPPLAYSPLEGSTESSQDSAQRSHARRASPDRASQASAAWIQITYPKQNMVFSIDPHLKPEFQAVMLTAAISDGAMQPAGDKNPPTGESRHEAGHKAGDEGRGEVRWLIDGRSAGTSSCSPATQLWQLQPGRHRLEAVLGTVKSTAVDFTVVK
ncbi:MAG: penicillin-binding protein 1C [Rhizobacter sp.]|nr:penicillin-binding protein 1C [Chlorobiales bacterium]